jgi:hypothetical protein
MCNLETIETAKDELSPNEDGDVLASSGEEIADNALSEVVTDINFQNIEQM